MADAPFGALAPGFTPSQPDQSQTALAMLLQARAQLAGQSGRSGLPDVGEPAVSDGGQFSPGTAVGNRAADIASRMAYGAGTELATLPRRALEASAADVGHLGEPGYEPQSIAPAVETALTMMGGSGAVPAEANSLRAGIKAYHGSPHDFDAFDLSKIGTGEGAQAYGHGLYFAENEGVAKQYRDALAGQVQNPARNQRMSDLAAEMSKYEMPGKYRQYSDPRGYDAAKEYDALMEARAADKGKMYEVNINADPAHFLDWDKPLSEQPAVASKLGFSPRSSDEINAEAEALFAKHGQYPNMPPEAKARVAELQAELDNRAPNVAGADYYRQSDPNSFLHSMLAGGSQSERSQQLAQSGIPGIKYLDQGSRNPGFSSLKPAQLDARIESLRSDLASGGGNQQRMSEQLANLERERETYGNMTHNYVVFNDKLIDIMRKYGLAGLPAAGVAGAAASDQAPFGALGR